MYELEFPWLVLLMPLAVLVILLVVGFTAAMKTKRAWACPMCGADLPRPARFCPQCGMRLDGER